MSGKSIHMADKEKEEGSDSSKYFDPKQYSTILVKANGETEYSEDKISNLIHLLSDPSNKDNRHEVLSMLRSNAKNAAPILVQAIESPKSEGKRHYLAAACWEAELNMSPYLVFFTELAIEDDYFVAMEAMTVIEEMAGPFNSEDVASSIEMVRSFINNNDSDKGALLSELLSTLEALPR